MHFLTYLPVSTRGDNLRISCERKEFGLEHVRLVSSAKGHFLLLVLPVPHDDIQVVRSGGQQGSVGVEMKRIDAAIMSLQLVGQFKSGSQSQ